MALIVSVDKNGRLVYDGLLTSKEKATIDEIIRTIKAEIPQIENELEEAYGNSVLYKYYLGAVLGGLLEKYQVSVAERRRFWDEIKNIASQEKRLRDEGKNAATRSFYEQCYRLSLIDQSIVEKLSWRQWQDLLDRTTNREDNRIFEWIGQHEPKIKESDWRGFEKALNLFLKKKDTSVFDRQELFDIYEMLLTMANCWNTDFDQFRKEYPKSAKIKTKSKWEAKYYELCFQKRKESRRNITADDCHDVFTTLMKQ